MLLLLVALSCSPPQRLDRAPEEVELARLQRYLQSRVPHSWSGSGHARLESSQGEIEGDLQLRLDPPRRAWLDLRTSAVFGMVSDGVSVALPGDGFVVIHHKRADVLERMPFSESLAATLTPHGSPSALFALTVGDVPWEGENPPEDLALCTRVLSVAKGGRILEFRLSGLTPTQSYVLRMDGDLLESLEWWDGGAKRLEVRYDRWRLLGGSQVPGRVRLRATQDRVSAQITLDSAELRDDFTEADFEVY